MKKVIEILRTGTDELRYYVIGEEDIVNVNVDEDGDWIEDTQDGFTKGFCFKDKWFVDHESSCDIFNEVDFEILDTDVDFFGTGYDRIIAKVDDEEKILISSRWQGHEGYYYEAE